jgi:bifunctional lysine-specific demethylase and histidyl-hydroxylase NO66
MTLVDLGFAVDDFVSGWPAEPIFRTAAAEVVNTLTLADVDELLSSRGVRSPSLRLVKDGSVIDPRTYLWAGRDGKTPLGLALADAAAVSGQVRSGSTLILQGLERLHPPVARLARTVASELGTDIFVNCFITPAEGQGFPEHADPYGAFLVQVLGAKRWELRPSADVPVEPVTLSAGDVLWMPRGWLHKGVAMPGAVSAHLTIAAMPITMTQIIDRLVATLPETVRSAGLAPRVALDPAGLRTALADMVARLTESMSQAELEPVMRDITRRLTELTHPPESTISDALGEGGAP